MGVTGTPIPGDGSSSDVACDTLQTAEAKITQLYGIELPTKQRAIKVQQAQVTNAELTILNAEGNPVDLTSCEELPTVSICLREALSTRDVDIETADGAITDADAGIISFTVPSAITRNPGVYHLEVGLLDDDDNLMFSNQLYLWVNRGLFGNPRYRNAGPPTFEEIRLKLRDNAPEENLLLDDHEYDLAEICHATENAIRFWNESQPPINLRFSTLSFSVRNVWLDYIVGHLMITASYRYLRNRLAYQSAGLSIDDQNKFSEYYQLGNQMILTYKEWVKNKKAEINAYGAMQSTGSPYSSMLRGY